MLALDVELQVCWINIRHFVATVVAPTPSPLFTILGVLVSRKDFMDVCGVDLPDLALCRPLPLAIGVILGWSLAGAAGGGTRGLSVLHHEPEKVLMLPYPVTTLRTSERIVQGYSFTTFYYVLYLQFMNTCSFYAIFRSVKRIKCYNMAAFIFCADNCCGYQTSSL